VNILEGFEEKVATAVRDLVAEAQAKAPQIDEAVTSALTDAGAPAELASLLGQALKAVVGHFEADHAQPAAEPQPDPAVPGA
jgi:hypothetical protein